MPFSWVRETLDGNAITEEDGKLTSNDLIKRLSVFYNRSSLEFKTESGVLCAASKIFDIADGRKSDHGIVIRITSDKPVSLLSTLIGSSLYIYEDDNIKSDIVNPDIKPIPLDTHNVLTIYINDHYVTDYKLVDK